MRQGFGVFCKNRSAHCCVPMFLQKRWNRQKVFTSCNIFEQRFIQNTKSWLNIYWSYSATSYFITFLPTHRCPCTCVLMYLSTIRALPHTAIRSIWHSLWYSAFFFFFLSSRMPKWHIERPRTLRCNAQNITECDQSIIQ